MREAIGGTMLMYIVLIFLFIYIFFMAIVINYGRVFRVKNTLISQIEASEGLTTVDSLDSLRSTATSLGYSPEGQIHVCYTEGKANTKYYRVKVFITFQIPMLGVPEAGEPGSIPISGETSAIRDISGAADEPSVVNCQNGYSEL